MKVGFYTSTFNDRPLEEVLDFAVAAGFEAIELDIGGHIRSPDNVASAVAMARDRGLYVSSVTLVGNQLEPDSQKRREFRTRTFDFAKAISEARAPIFVIFPGRDDTVSVDENYKNFAEYAGALIASTSGLEFAIENWPGPHNDFIATTPEGWRDLFALLPDERLGLEFDPSHLIRLGIDPYAALEGVRDRIKILHAKDTSIDAERLQTVGYNGVGWWRYRLPGSGMLDWIRFLRQAKNLGYARAIAIEHEDSDFGWPRKDLEARKLGERKSLEFLRATLAAL
jgi:sugar phosphate isomerase/epimerase